MNEDKKEYTFEDWKNGLIPVPPCPESYKEEGREYRKEHWDSIWGSENRLMYWKEKADPPRLTSPEYKRICNAKTDAWFKAAEDKAQELLEAFETENESYQTPEHEIPDLIQLEIEKVQELLKKTDQHQAIRRGRTESDKITPEEYNNIQEGEFIMVDLDISVVDDGTWRGDIQVSGRIKEGKELLGAWALYKYLEKLERLLSEIKGEAQQVGRPRDFSREDSKNWYYELKENPEYQHKNGKPHRTNIMKEIINRHETKTGYRPSLRTIKRHV